ncbi:MAG: DUF6476 family protein [Pseudomonadota bacterium]
MNRPTPTPRLSQDEDLPEPPQVRRLRYLVSGLTLASIIAVLAIAATVFIRLGLAPQEPAVSTAPAPVTAEALRLPEGETITTIGQSGGVILAVTEDGEGALSLRRWDAETGAQLSVTPILRD